MSSPPQLLSQQIASWLLQAAGVVASNRVPGTPRRVSASTIKSGLAGRPILRSWATLHAEVLGLFGAEPTEAQIADLSESLRKWDQRISRMDTLGLDQRALLPALLRMTAPELGVRFGAMAALAQPRSTPALPISDWLCDPLSPATFGRTVEALFTRHRPELTTWAARYAQLKGIERTTVEDWRSETFDRVPNVSNIRVVAEAMGADPHVLTTLRLARVLCVLREMLSDDPDLCRRFADSVASWARITRGLLMAPTELAALAEQYAVALEGPAGSNVVAKLAPFLGPGGVSPGEVAARIRAAATRVRERDAVDDLRWLQMANVLEPHPVLVGIVGANLGIPFERALHDTLHLVEAEWRAQSFLLRVADGVPMGWSPDDVPPQTRPLSEPVRMFARVLYEEKRRICRRDGDPTPEPFGIERLMLTLSTELGGDAAVRATVGAMNEAARIPLAPAPMEQVVDETVITAFPAWMAERARRLATAGKVAEAKTWIRRWAQSEAPRSEAERRAVAEAAVAMAHRSIDGARPQREYLAAELPCPLEALPPDLAAKVTDTVAMCRKVLGINAQNVRKLWDVASGVWHVEEGSAAEVDRLVLLLPLAVRLDLLEADATGDEPFLTLSEPLAERLQDPERALPDHGPAWAVRALWQRVLGDEDGLSVRWATHWGSLGLYEAEVERLVADGSLAEDTR